MNPDHTIKRLMERPHPHRKWMRSGLCTDGYDVAIFFPRRDGDSSEAKSICNRCPSEMTCLEYALKYREEYGVWGGMSEKERSTLRSRILRNDPEWLKVS